MGYKPEDWEPQVMPPAAIHFPSANDLGISEEDLKGTEQESSVRQENYIDENEEIEAAIQIHLTK